MLLSVIIPSYNEAKILKAQLPGLITHLNSKEIEYEIIIVDDGSKDQAKTEIVARDLNVRFERNHVNMGKGATVRNGILKSKGDYVIFTDVDIPFEFECLDNVLHYLSFKEFDIVVGDRTINESVYFKEISTKRKLVSGVFTFIVSRFVTTGFPDTQCGLKGFKSQIAKGIFSVSQINGFTFDVELIYIALKRNYDIKRLPVKLRLNNNNESTVKIFKHGFLMLLDLGRIKFYQLQNKYRI